jgi:hypothetical protein
MPRNPRELISLLALIGSACGGQSSPAAPSPGGPGDYHGSVLVAPVSGQSVANLLCGEPSSGGVVPPASQFAVRVSISGRDISITVVPGVLYEYEDGPDQTVFRGTVAGTSFDVTATDLPESVIGQCGSGKTVQYVVRTRLVGQFSTNFAGFSAQQSEAATLADGGSVTSPDHVWTATLTPGDPP